jgi:uncharacterized protein
MPQWQFGYTDWFLTAVIVLVIPAYAYFSRARLAKLGGGDRRPVYLRTIATLWALALLTLWTWCGLHGRPPEALGLTLEPGPVTTAAGFVCAMILIAVLSRIRATARMAPERAARLAERIGGAAPILPRTRAELLWFFAVAVTAGICEEILYRGYLMAVAAPLLTPFGAAAAAAAVFAAGHVYQGPRGVLLTGAVGLLLGGLYVLTGSLLWPILAHVLIDVNGGTLGYLLLRARTPR